MPLEIYKRYDYEAINNLTLVTSLHFTRSTSKQGQGKQKRVIIQKTCIGKALYAAAP